MKKSRVTRSTVSWKERRTRAMVKRAESQEATRKSEDEGFPSPFIDGGEQLYARAEGVRLRSRGLGLDVRA